MVSSSLTVFVVGGGERGSTTWVLKRTRHRGDLVIWLRASIPIRMKTRRRFGVWIIWANLFGLWCHFIIPAGVHTEQILWSLPH